MGKKGTCISFWMDTEMVRQMTENCVKTSRKRSQFLRDSVILELETRQSFTNIAINNVPTKKVGEPLAEIEDNDLPWQY